MVMHPALKETITKKIIVTNNLINTMITQFVIKVALLQPTVNLIQSKT